MLGSWVPIENPESILALSEEEVGKTDEPSPGSQQGKSVNSYLPSSDTVTTTRTCQLEKPYPLSVEEQRLADELFAKFPTLFAKNPKKPGVSKLSPHYIDTGNARPIKCKGKRLTYEENQLISKEVPQMLENGIIRPSQSPWSFPVVIVPKKDGSKRFCINYMRLNSITKKDTYPLPRIDETLDALGKARIFSTLDMPSGYWQIKIAEQDKPKTAFACREGLFEWNVMPFGLCNAPATFQRAMDILLAGLSWKICLVYLDDVIVFSASFKEHLKHLELVFSRFVDANLTLKKEKCSFFQTEVKYLGHITNIGWCLSRFPKELCSPNLACTYGLAYGSSVSGSSFVL